MQKGREVDYGSA